LLYTLRALDHILNSTPLAQHQNIDYYAIVRPDAYEPQLLPKSDPKDQILRNQLFNYVKDRFPQPFGIPAAFVEAYKAALAGRIFVNEIKADDFLNGRACTCSESLRYLSDIDNIAGTRLQERFDAICAQGTSRDPK
jgi:hypothetical protein